MQDAAEDIQESKSSRVKNLINTLARQTIESNTPRWSGVLERTQKHPET